MKEQIKTPEKELGDKEIDNLSDAEFKTLVIEMLTELIELDCKMKGEMALAGVAQWTEHRPVNQRVAGSIRAHAWVVGQVPNRGLAKGNHTLMFLSLSFSLPSPLSKNKISKIFF